MSKIDDREDIIKKQLNNLRSGKYGKSFDKSYIDDIEEDYKSEKDIIHIDINSLHSAPEEWNFFPPISNIKMLEMVFSILENGLFNPIIVWEQENGCMILSGHNRVKAYKKILEEYEGMPDFDENKYKTIPSIVFTKDEIDENKAKEIIIDTNYIQREEDKKLMPQIIKNRLDIVRKRKDKKGRTIDIVAEELGLSKTKVYEDQLIANRIIPELNDFYFNEIIGKKALLRFAWFNEEIQRWIYNEFKDSIENDVVMGIKKGMNKENITKCFNNGHNKIKKITISVRIPEHLKDDFRKMAKEWIKEKLNSL